MLYVVIDLGAPGDEVEDCLPEVFGPFPDKESAVDWVENIDANGGVSAIAEIKLADDDSDV